MLAALVPLLLTPTAPAQLLDLGDPAPPDPDFGSPALDAAAYLESQARRVGRATAPGADARAAVRSLAAALLRHGSVLADRGSAHVLAGRTLARGLDEIDAVIADASASGALDDVALGLLAIDLGRLADEPPDEPAALDRRLRNALAPLTNHLGPAPAHAGWRHVDPPEPRQALRTLAAIAATSDHAAFADTAALLQRAVASPAFARSADHAARRIVRAHAALSVERTLSGPDRDAVAARFLDAAASLTGVDPAAGERELDRLALLASALAATDALPQSNVQKHARAVLVDALRGDPSPSTAALTAYLAATELIAQDPPPDDDRLVRQLRVPWRALQREAGATAADLTLRLSALLTQPDPMTDPAILSALGARRRALDALDGLLDLNAFLAVPTPGPARPRPAPQRRRLADRALRLGTLVIDGDLEARATLDELIEQARAFAELPGEAALVRAVTDPTADPFLTAHPEDLRAAHEAALLDAIEDARRSWSLAWTRARTARDVDAEASAMRLLADLMAALRDVRTLDAARADGSFARHWPGWELAQPAADALADPLRSAAPGLVELAIAAAWNELGDRLAHPLVRSPAVRLIVELERGAPRGGTVHVLHELGLGPPDADAWLAGWRAELASICRYAEDWYAARAAGDRARARRLHDVLDTRSARVLRAMGG